MFSNKVLLTTGALLVAFGIGAGVIAHALKSSAPTATGPTVNLLKQDWNYLAGNTNDADTLTVAATDAKILNQDGSGGQPNPAVNLYGTHLKVSGDFAVTTHFKPSTTGAATVQLYDKPPIIADEFRIESASIAVTLRGNNLHVRVWSGAKQSDATQPKTVFSQIITLPETDGDVVISRVGKDLTVQTSQTTITAKGKGSLFRSGAVWLGLNGDDDTLTVDKLEATALGNSTLSAVDTTSLHGVISADGLQALAAKTRPDFKVGAAVALGPWVSDETYASQLFQNFGAITLENAMKPQFISPRQGLYTFQEADAIIAIARQNGMHVHGHTLAFSEGTPAWMRKLPTSTPADREATSAILLDYVSHVMTHFKGQLDSIDVINEPLDPDQGPEMQQNIWYRAMGPDYTVRVSQLVHSIDPDVKQFVNENGAEMSGERQDALFDLIQHINTAGGFIYGVGLQTHVYDMGTDAIDAKQLNKTFDRFDAAGLRVRISENDVTDDAGTKAQAVQYASTFMACLRNANCVSYTTWGVNDRYDWFIDDDGSTQQGHDLLFNGAKPTAAFTAIKKQLQ
jgi:endo-1,4-beta-xylanase